MENSGCVKIQEKVIVSCVNKYNLTLVSFDSDFDKSPVKRKVPAELIA